MPELKSVLINQGYSFFKLKKTVSKHFVLKAKINNIKGNFIIDTGASNSCLGIDTIDLYHLKLSHTDKKAAGAGSTNIETQISRQNSLKIKHFEIKNLTLVVIDLTHINMALSEHKTKPVNGIIGADVLQKYGAIINYKDKTLYLRR